MRETIFKKGCTGIISVSRNKDIFAEDFMAKS